MIIGREDVIIQLMIIHTEKNYHRLTRPAHLRWMLQIVYPFQSPVLNIRHKYPKLITDEGDDVEYVTINKSGDEQQQIMTAIDEGKRLTYDDAQRLNEMILHTGVPYVGKQKNGAQPTFNLYNIVKRFSRRTMRHPDYSINDNPYGEELPLPPPPPREPLGDTRPAHLRSKTRIAPRTNPNPPGARRRTRKGRRKAKKKEQNGLNKGGLDSP